MGDKTAIEWADASWTPIRARNRQTGKVGWFCSHASAGCVNCYAEGINRRLGTGIDFKAQNLGQVEVFLDETMLTQPLRWRRPRKIFVCSMTDLFGEFVSDDTISRVFAIMALCPQHTFQVLTKRSERMRTWFASYARVVSPGFVERVYQLGHRIPGVGYDTPEFYKVCAAATATWPLPNVWLGASVEDQPNADARLTDLLMTPAAVRFVSYEPALGPIDFKPWLWTSNSLNNPTPYPMLKGPRCGESIVPAERIHQVIVGGESGPGARPCWTPDVRMVVRQCAESGCAVFVKQLGGNVQDRDDAGFEGCEPSEWPDIDPDRIEHDVNGYREEYQGAPVRIRLRSRKGADPAEWPEDLRRREVPAAANLTAHGDAA